MTMKAFETRNKNDTVIEKKIKKNKLETFECQYGAAETGVRMVLADEW